MVFYFQKQKPVATNGNGYAEKIGGIVADVKNLQQADRETKLGMSENQRRIGEISGNVNQLSITLAQLVARQK
jgi:hypothetical protein